MAKKSAKQINTEKLRIYLLHKECVRRNPEFIKQQQEIQRIESKGHREWKEYALMSDWGFWKTEKFLDLEERPNLDKLKRATASSEISLPCDFVYDLYTSRALDLVQFNLLDLFTDEIRNKLKGTLLLINVPEEPEPVSLASINMRSSKKDIQQSMLGWADHYVADRKKHGLKQESQSERMRVEQCFEYLKVYDLREEGKSFGQIAKILWPKADEDMRRQAGLYYQKAKDLIRNPPIRKKLLDQFQKRKNSR